MKAIYSKQHTQVTASVRGSQLRILWHSRIDSFPAQDVCSFPFSENQQSSTILSTQETLDSILISGTRAKLVGTA